MRSVRRRLIAGAGLVLVAGCVSPSLQSERLDVVYNPDLVQHCTLKGEGKYTTLGESNALTMAKNAAAERGSNVLLVLSIRKGEALTTEVQGKMYSCAEKR